jgi:16S rRNA (guanine966-N2)-methyltransferase
MRVISGILKGRRYDPPADKWPTRPTTDYSKEALYNILENRISFENIKVLDLFGGSGSHTYESISRGADHVTYVDKFHGCHKFVRSMLATWSIQEQVTLVRADVFRFIPACSDTFSYIFAGPPYGMPGLDTLPDLIFDKGLLKPGGIFVLEHNQHHSFENHPFFSEERNYGQTHFSFFEIRKQANAI